MSSNTSIGALSKGEIPPLPEPEAIVDQVIKLEKEEVCRADDSFWEMQKQMYLGFEKYFRDKEKVPQIAGHLGPLHYGMSPSEMEAIVKKIFQEMVSAGKMLRQRDLTKRATFYPPEPHKGSDDLTRIWGAAFLNANLHEDSKLKAVDHYLIVDDEASEIEVEIFYLNNYYPFPRTVRNAQILRKKIDGVKSAHSLTYQCDKNLKALNYVDFKDPGNIIRAGIGWIVDTERKSFDSMENICQDITFHNYLTYLKKRFSILYPAETFNRRFKISVSDIGLDILFPPKGS